MQLPLQNSSSLFLQGSGAEKSYVRELVYLTPASAGGLDICVQETLYTSVKGDEVHMSVQLSSFIAGTIILNTKTRQNISAKVMLYTQQPIVNANL